MNSRVAAATIVLFCVAIGGCSASAEKQDQGASGQGGKRSDFGRNDGGKPAPGGGAGDGNNGGGGTGGDDTSPGGSSGAAGTDTGGNGGNGGGMAGSDTPQAGSAGAAGDPTPTPDAGVSPGNDEACLAYAAAECAKYQECRPYRFRLDETSFDNCKLYASAFCGRELVLNGVKESAASVLACAQALPKASCPEYHLGIKACWNVPGAFANGKACGFDGQCSSGFCEVTAGQCGKCQSKRSLGKACDYDSDCKDGLICRTNETAGADQCVTAVKVNGACDHAARQCEGYLVCKASKCVAPSQLGQKCTDGAGECDRSHGLHCDGATSKCADNPTATVGNGCGGVKDIVCEKSYCNAVAPANGVCVGRQADGANCADGDECGSFICEGGKCVAWAPSTCE